MVSGVQKHEGLVQAYHEQEGAGGNHGAVGTGRGGGGNFSGRVGGVGRVKWVVNGGH